MKCINSCTEVAGKKRDEIEKRVTRCFVLFGLATRFRRTLQRGGNEFSDFCYVAQKVRLHACTSDAQIIEKKKKKN